MAIAGKACSVNRLDIICVGSAKYDTNARIARLPLEDERIVTERIVNAAGGNANTAAASAARQGVSVALCTVIGDDPAGDYILGQMREYGIDSRYVIRRENVDTPQSVNIACSDTASRFLIVVNSPAIEVEAVLDASPAWFHFDADGFKAARTAIQSGRLKGRVSVDAGVAIGIDLRGVDLYAPTRERIIADFGGSLEDAMRAAVANGAGEVVVTIVAEGSAILSCGVISYQPAYPVEVLSTLGAGDVFHGALVAALVRDLPLGEAVRCATVAAALSCRALDGQSAIPTRAELDRHLAGFTAP